MAAVTMIVSRRFDTALLVLRGVVGAIMFVHLTNGFFLPNDIEFALVMFAACFALILTGAGGISFDAMFSHRRVEPRERRHTRYHPRPTTSPSGALGPL